MLYDSMTLNAAVAAVGGWVDVGVSECVRACVDVMYSEHGCHIRQWNRSSSVTKCTMHAPKTVTMQGAHSENAQTTTAACTYPVLWRRQKG